MDAIHCKFTQKIENLQGRALRFLSSDKENSYEKSFASLMNVKRLRVLALTHAEPRPGKKILRVFGPKLWNSPPYHIKSFENLESFRRTIKQLSIGMENAVSVIFVIVFNELIFCFNLDISLFLLRLF